METLEEILIKYCGCDGEPFDIEGNGDLTPAGDKAYSNLIGIICALEGLDLIDNASRIISKLDEIIDKNGECA